MSDSSKPAAAAPDTIAPTRVVGDIMVSSWAVAYGLLAAGCAADRPAAQLRVSNADEPDQVWQWLRLLLQRHGTVLVHALWIPPGLFALYFLWSFTRAVLGWD